MTEREGWRVGRKEVRGGFNKEIEREKEEVKQSMLPVLAP